MNKNKIILIILTIYSLNIIAQDKANNNILKHYYNVDIPFFIEKNTQYKDKPLYKAVKNWIQGNEAQYINYLEEALRQESSNKKISKLLFEAYVKSRQINKAFELNKSKKLGYSKNRNTDYAKSIFGKPRLQMNVSSTTVKFDGIYFKAIVNTIDTVSVFIDTGAPGITVSNELAEKYNWEIDTTYSDEVLFPFINNLKIKRFPVLIPNLTIGEAHFFNISGTAMSPTKEEKKQLYKYNKEDYDIIMGLDIFYGLIEGIDISYKDNQITLLKNRQLVLIL